MQITPTKVLLILSTEKNSFVTSPGVPSVCTLLIQEEVSPPPLYKATNDQNQEHFYLKIAMSVKFCERG